MTDDELRSALDELDQLSERRQSLFNQLVREDSLGLECPETVEMEQIENELGCRGRLVLPEIRRLMSERDTWKERADACSDQETTPPHVWKAQKAVIEATKRWVLTDEDYDSRHIDDAVRELLAAERG
jgi:hypothetical protein